jgi:hypothetical protein
MMTKAGQLYIYEEVMLLALRDEQGTIAIGFPEQLVAGAILAELLLDGHISIDKTRKQLVDVKFRKRTGDPIIDECLEKMRAAKRRASLQAWINRLAGIKQLRHKVAQQLCDRKILRAGEDKILLLFKRRIYPEINPLPETKIIDRLREAVFNDRRQLNPRTIVLVSLANGADLLQKTFGRQEIKTRKKRIEQIAKGDLTGEATREVIAACQAALIVATIIPVVVTSSVSS